MTDRAPDHATADPQDAADADGDVEVLPWWRNPLNLIAVVLALVVLSGAAGYVIGHNLATDDPSDVDVGFLHDMRFHHEQATQMGLIFLDTEGTDTRLRTIAREIVVGQQIEVGRMIQMLRDYGEPEANDGDFAMAWMGQRVPLEQMPGLATDDELRGLAGADGADADAAFVRLMTAHHEGGIHMAEYAAEHARDGKVRSMAAGMVVGQRSEIAEMARIAATPRAG